MLKDDSRSSVPLKEIHLCAGYTLSDTANGRAKWTQAGTQGPVMVTSREETENCTWCVPERLLEMFPFQGSGNIADVLETGSQSLGHWKQGRGEEERGRGLGFLSPDLAAVLVVLWGRRGLVGCCYLFQS